MPEQLRRELKHVDRKGGERALAMKRGFLFLTFKKVGNIYIKRNINSRKYYNIPATSFSHSISIIYTYLVCLTTSWRQYDAEGIQCVQHLAEYKAHPQMHYLLNLIKF